MTDDIQEANGQYVTGRYGCVGKNLALMETRHINALLTLKYDIRLSPGSDHGANFLRNTKDHFTTVPGRSYTLFLNN